MGRSHPAQPLAARVMASRTVDDLVGASYTIVTADPVEAAVDSLIEETIRAAEQRDRRHLSPVGGEQDVPRKPTRAPVEPFGVSLYVGDLFDAGKGLVRAEYELWACQRFSMDPPIAAAIADAAVAAGELVNLIKWVQDELRGISWHDRPELRRTVGAPTKSVATFSSAEVEERRP